MYGSNRFKTGEHCKSCIYDAGFCTAPGQTVTAVPCDPVNRLYDIMRPRKVTPAPKTSS